MFSLEPQEWHREGLADLTDYNIAKFFADNYLISNTKLDYTILQPASLTEEKGTGKVSINGSGKQNAIPNVAQVLAALLKHDNTIKKVIRMSDGDQNIDDALTEL
jgi:hypothetical protein